MNFNDFINSRGSSKKNTENVQNQSGSTQKTNMPNADQLENIINKYQGFSQEDLVQELITQINTQKQNGTWNKQEMENMLSAVRPMLNEEQQKNLDTLKKILE